jgi:hypothetical protein
VAIYTYHVWGIRRSGNHAVVGWILKHRGLPYVHFNDIQDPRDPLTPGGIDVSGVPMWKYKRGLLRKIRYRFFARNRSSFAGSDPSLDYRGLAAVPSLACRVFSYEDKLVADTRCASGIALPGESSRSVLLLRDPFNLFASLLRSGYFSRDLDELPAVYLSHAEKFLSRNDAQFVGINYNDWVQDAGYRISIARQLGFGTDGAAYEHVPRNGGGSSFSGRNFTGKAWRMDVFGRWRHMAENEHFLRLISTPQIRAVATRIFPALASEVYGALSARRSRGEAAASR